MSAVLPAQLPAIPQLFVKIVNEAATQAQCVRLARHRGRHRGRPPAPPCPVSPLSWPRTRARSFCPMPSLPKAQRKKLAQAALQIQARPPPRAQQLKAAKGRAGNAVRARRGGVD